MNYRFHPPRHNRFVLATVNALLPALLAWRERIVRVQVAPEDRRRLEMLRGRRALLLPNHPSESEPPVMIWLARELGEPFFFAATHEIFRGFNGWLVPRMGAFSILRGRPDFAAMRTARDVLVARNAKLVLFPEGETHMQNDLVLPLHRGAAQIGLWALRDLERAGQPPTLPAVPIAIRYRYVGDVRPVLLAGMARLERCLGLPPPTADAQNLPDRLRRTGLVVLAGVEREYGLTPRQGGTLDARIAAVTEHVAARVAHVLPVRSRIATNRELPVFLRMRALFNATFDYLDGLAEGTTAYERRLHARRLAAARACIADLWRMQNFMVVGEHTLAPPVSDERLGEVLFRLEKEVYGRARTRPPREAIVRVGAPLELADHLPDYHASRKQTLQCVTNELKARLRALLDSGG